MSGRPDLRLYSFFAVTLTGLISFRFEPDFSFFVVRYTCGYAAEGGEVSELKKRLKSGQR